MLRFSIPRRIVRIRAHFARSMSDAKCVAADSSAFESFTLKTPKGMRDYSERETALRNRILNAITNVFELYGAVTIDTPTVELKEILTGKYGEDSKLIYDLADQGGELSSLRYDLTVPLARYSAQHGVKRFKRYQVGKVYRRDQPNISRGRLREFYQCDFDIIGQYSPMVPEAECLSAIVTVLGKLQIGDFYIKINHRCLLDEILLIAGVPNDKVRTISSSIDKLDKKPWSEVADEIVNVKGIDIKVAEKIKKYVLTKSKCEMCRELSNDPEISKNDRASKALSEMKLLSEYLESYSIDKKVLFDLSLARGLDYYTGVIYEAVIANEGSEYFQELGSVAGGGRYDNLIKMFSGNEVGCVGFSIGCERIFSLIASKLDMSKVRACHSQVLVASLGSVHIKEVLKLSNELRSSGVPTENLMKTGQNIQAYFSHCTRCVIPYIIFVGPKELESNMFAIKYALKGSKSTPSQNVIVKRHELAHKLKEMISAGAANLSENSLDIYYC